MGCQMNTKDIITGQKVQPEKYQRAKELRQNMTEAEKILWQHLRANRLKGWHFRRQQIIDGFIVDFYCHKAGLVIEVDGPIHEGQHIEDAQRETALVERGLSILRFTNKAIMNNPQDVLMKILHTLETNSPSQMGRG